MGGRREDKDEVLSLPTKQDFMERATTVLTSSQLLGHQRARCRSSLQSKTYREREVFARALVRHSGKEIRTLLSAMR